VAAIRKTRSRVVTELWGFPINGRLKSPGSTEFTRQAVKGVIHRELIDRLAGSDFERFLTDEVSGHSAIASSTNFSGSLKSSSELLKSSSENDMGTTNRL
jgi:hypothetical protein